jgi:hypothetical protein
VVVVMDVLYVILWLLVYLYGVYDLLNARAARQAQ